MIYHPLHLTDEKTKAQRGLSSERTEWQTVLSHLEGMQPLVTYLQGQEKSLSTEMAHSIFADSYFPEQAQGHVLFSGQDFWRQREIEI